MDDHVLRGMVRWPDVPAVFGWLALDRRGNWLLKGEAITNPTITGYLGRNYERDAEGRWFFQNGPQRVYVELAYTPFVYRVVSAGGEPLAIESHTGKRAATLAGAWIDEDGALLLETEHGVGVLDDRDLEAALAALIDANGTVLPEAALEEALALVEQGRDAPVWFELGDSNVKVEAIRSADVPGRFAFTQRPEPSPGQSVASGR
jgi:hypothetical protein